MIARRGAIALIGGIAFAPSALGAQHERPRRVGLLSPDDSFPGLEIVRAALRDLGHVEGRDLVLVTRNAGGESARLPQLAEELVRLGVDVILALNTPAVRAAKNATQDVPIVMMRVADPVTMGLVASLSRPGGNVTGLSFIPDELSGKRLELLKEMMPGAARVAALWFRDNPGSAALVREMEAASGRLGIELDPVPVDSGTVIPDRLADAANAGAKAVIIVDDAFVTRRKAEILEAAARRGLPVFAMWKEFAQAGALAAYGPSDATYRRAAEYVDKILKGTRPADLPVEQPTTFDLYVNLATARSLGLSVPVTLLAQAQEVIE